jgi:hypothetical protein
MDVNNQSLGSAYPFTRRVKATPSQAFISFAFFAFICGQLIFLGLLNISQIRGAIEMAEPLSRSALRR